MKHKRLVTAFVALAFLVIVVLGACSVLTVKSVNIEFAVAESGQAYSSSVQADLDKYLNKSIVLLKENDVAETLKKYPYLELMSIAKRLPSDLDVTLRERQEIYRFATDDGYAVLDETGFVLNKNASYNDKLIDISGLTLSVSNVGAYAACEKQEETDLLNIAFKMSEIAAYTDSVKKIKIVCATERSDVIFYMRTGVKIIVDKASEDGEAKMQLAFDVFNGEPVSNGKIISDYEKSGWYILAFKQDDGKVVVSFTEDIGDRYDDIGGLEGT